MKRTILIILAFTFTAILTYFLVPSFHNGDRSKGEVVTSLGKIVDEPIVRVWWGFWTGKEAYIGISILNSEGEPHTIFLKYRPPKETETIFDINEFSQREAAVWTGKKILIFGGAVLNNGSYTPVNQILSFNPETLQLSILNVSLPYPTTDIAAVWDGKQAYLFIRDELGDSKPEIYVFHPENETITKLNISYPVGFEHPGSCIHSAVWSDGKVYFFYGKRIACFEKIKVSSG